jgi:hypothetical protein
MIDKLPPVVVQRSPPARSAATLIVVMLWGQRISKASLPCGTELAFWIKKAKHER